MQWHVPNEWIIFQFRFDNTVLNQQTTSIHWSNARIAVLQKALNVVAITRIILGADVELPTPQKLEWGTATVVRIAEANQSGLSWSRGRTRYLGDILATAATVTNEFCLGETQEDYQRLPQSLYQFY